MSPSLSSEDLFCTPNIQLALESISNLSPIRIYHPQLPSEGAAHHYSFHFFADKEAVPLNSLADSPKKCDSGLSMMREQSDLKSLLTTRFGVPKRAKTRACQKAKLAEN